MTAVFDDPDAAIAAVACEPPVETVGQLALHSFEDSDVMRESWETDATVATEVEEADDACKTSEPGTRKWGFGNITCLIDDDGLAQLRWTDARIGMLGRAKATNDDIPALFAWWQENGRKIGRTGDSAPAEPKDDEPKASKPGKLVRVPGAPKDITCSTGDPLPDEWDRAWRLKNIVFRNRAGYERVILNLERTGKNRSKWPTQALVERMPVSAVAKAVPKASKPRRGRLAYVVRLDGVRDAPNLFRYRPNDLDLIKEVSVVKDGAGRAVVISVPKDTCYQMRIPVWGPNATGNERKAEVFIDFKTK